MDINFAQFWGLGRIKVRTDSLPGEDSLPGLETDGSSLTMSSHEGETESELWCLPFIRTVISSWAPPL